MIDVPSWEIWGPGENCATRRNRYQRFLGHRQQTMRLTRQEIEGALVNTFRDAYVDPCTTFSGSPADKVLMVQVEDDRCQGLAKYCSFGFNGMCEPRVSVILPTGESKHYAATSVFPAPDGTPIPPWVPLTPYNLPATLSYSQPQT